MHLQFSYFVGMKSATGKTLRAESTSWLWDQYLVVHDRSFFKSIRHLHRANFICNSWKLKCLGMASQLFFWDWIEKMNFWLYSIHYFIGFNTFWRRRPSWGCQRPRSQSCTPVASAAAHPEPYSSELASWLLLYESGATYGRRGWHRRGSARWPNDERIRSWKSGKIRFFHLL